MTDGRSTILGAFGPLEIAEALEATGCRRVKSAGGWSSLREWADGIAATFPHWRGYLTYARGRWEIHDAPGVRDEPAGLWPVE